MNIFKKRISLILSVVMLAVAILPVFIVSATTAGIKHNFIVEQCPKIYGTIRLYFPMYFFLFCFYFYSLFCSFEFPVFLRLFWPSKNNFPQNKKHKNKKIRKFFCEFWNAKRRRKKKKKKQQKKKTRKNFLCFCTITSLAHHPITISNSRVIAVTPTIFPTKI